MLIQDFPYILYRFDRARSDTFFDINSSSKTLISNREYLQNTMGAGGHIVGFLKYIPSMESENTLNYTTIKGAITAFRDNNHPDLIVLDPWDIFGLIWTNTLIDATNYEINETIPINPDKLKFAQLGEQMSRPNTAEIDFVGDMKIQAKVFRNIKESKTVEHILSKEYLAFYKHLPTLPQSGLTATIPLDTKPFWGAAKRKIK